MRPSVYLCGAALLFAGAAQAVTVTSVTGAPDPGFGVQTLVVDFDAPNAAGYTMSGDFAVTINSSGAAAAPALDATNYAYVSSALGSGIATLSTPNLSAISFYWGSIDTYNSVDVLGAGGVVLKTVSGGDIPPANGDQSSEWTNRRVSFAADSGEVIAGLRFNSTGVAFEFDTVAATAVPTTRSDVPEPASWAMFVAGFGMIGAAARKRRRNVVTA
jgi:hypothetical protein